jgi:Ala-tRNA(Pro) deacylase
MKTKITEYLQTSGIVYKVINHEPVYTVAESMLHLPDAYPVKNLLLKEEKGDRCIFVIMKGDERLDTKLVSTKLDTKKLQFAKPDVLLAKLGVEPGSASLFSLLHDGSADVEVVVDSRLISQKEVGFHPSDNTQTIIISGQDILTFMNGLRHLRHELEM